MPSTRSRAVAPLLVLPLLLGVLGACGVSKDDDAQSDSTPTAAATPSPSASPTPSPTPTETASPSSTTPAASPSLTAQQALLTAAEMPALDETVRWSERRTAPAGPQVFGLCARFDMLSIGAEQAVQRTFAAGSQGTAGSDRAAQQIATFPDLATAARAEKVLRAWHDTCAARVHLSGLQVAAITSVPVTSGQGWWYSTSFVRRGGARHVQSFGVAVGQTRISLIRIDQEGHHDYPAGQDPMELAVKTAATKLG